MRVWVREEWQTAFQRSVEEKRSFLIMARIEDYPLPRMLRHRLCIDLFADFASGTNALIANFKRDGVAAQRSGRPIVQPTLPTTEIPSGAEIYVTSHLFACTTPVRVNLDEPCAMVVERFVRDMGFPKQVAHGGAVGFRMGYAFSRDHQRLEAGRSLSDQGVSAKNPHDRELCLVEQEAVARFGGDVVEDDERRWPPVRRHRTEAPSPHSRGPGTRSRGVRAAFSFSA